MQGYAYFWNGLIKIAENLKPRLTEEHRGHMLEMFGLGI